MYEIIETNSEKAVNKLKAQTQKEKGSMERGGIAPIFSQA